MRKTTIFLLAVLLASPALAVDVTIDDLDAASSLNTSDMLACAQGTTVTKKCSLEQVKDWLITYFDTEAELEGVLTDVANLIISTEIDTEAELEALLSDVSNMIVSTEIDTEAELEALLGDVTDVYTDTDTDFIDADSMADADHGAISWTTGVASIDSDVITAAQMGDDDHGDVDWTSGVATVQAMDADIVTQAEVADDAIQEEHLKAVNAATDEYFLTYESTTGDFEWQAGSGGGATSEGGLETALTDTANVLTDNDASITFDAGIDLITSANGDIDLSPNGTGVVNANAEFNTQASATPTITWQDSDAGVGAGNDGDDNVTASVNCTVVTTGAEDCDLTIQQQIAGAATDVLVANADGAGNARIVLPDSSIGPDEIMVTGQTDGYFLQYESTGDTVQWAVGSGGAFDDSSDPVVQNTTTKVVHFGDGAGTLAGKVEIGGDADQPQLVVEGHSAQTVSPKLVVVQNDADIELFSIANDGTTVIAGSTSTITGSGTYVEIDDVLYITPAATPPIACTTNAGIMYHDTSGVICICDGSSAWVEVVDYTTTGTCE